MKPSAVGRVRVATFNLLAACTTAWLRTNRPECVPLAHRWPLLLKSLRRLMNKECILLLQEVDTEIEAAGLYELLCTRGYVYMTASPVNGRHGSVLAYPTRRYHATELCKERVGLNVQRPPQSLAPQTWGKGEALSREASARGRLMPWACLTDKQTLVRFCVFGYHNICAFARPSLMALKLDAVLRGCHALARGMPFILAGDFNMLPGSSLHRLATTGFADAECAPWPGFAVSPVTDPLGRFPGLVTNHTPDFAGKIDYIFTSKEHPWRLTGFSIERFIEPAPNLLQGKMFARPSRQKALVEAPMSFDQPVPVRDERVREDRYATTMTHVPLSLFPVSRPASRAVSLGKIVLFSIALTALLFFVWVVLAADWDAWTEKPRAQQIKELHAAVESQQDYKDEDDTEQGDDDEDQDQDYQGDKYVRRAWRAQTRSMAPIDRVILNAGGAILPVMFPRGKDAFKRLLPDIFGMRGSLQDLES